MESSKKSYYAIIPATVRYDENLPANAKLLYGEITALCNSEGYCWASNRYFADLYEVTTITVSRWLNALAKRGYIRSEIVFKEGTKEIDKRYIQICYDPINKNDNTPINEIVKDNNTSSFNNTFNNINKYRDKQDKPTKKFVPPTVEEIEAYCKKRNNNVDAQKFFDYYDAAEWHDKNGDKIKSWKQKVITWEGRNNQQKGGEKNDKDVGANEENQYAKWVTGGTVL